METVAFLRINLYTKKKEEREEPAAAFPVKIPLISLGACLGISLLFFFVATWQGLIYTNLKANLHKLQPEKEAFDALKGEVSELNKKVSALNQLKIRGFRWSKKLNQLSDSLIPGIWLRDLYLDQDKRQGTSQTEKGRMLVLEGSAAYPGSQNETALVSQFIQKIKSDKDFFESFSDVELKNVARRKIKNTEIMDFVIGIYFKETE